MKKNFSFKGVAVPAIALLIIAGIITALLASTNMITKDKIAEQNTKKQEETLKTVLPSFDKFDSIDSDNNGSTDYYIAKSSSGEIIGYAFNTSANGYGGAVTVMTGITAEGEVYGVAILEHNETPGLGANATKDDFRNQYKQQIPSDGEFKVEKDGGTIVALTGATITSRAVSSAVNEAISLYKSIA